MVKNKKEQIRFRIDNDWYDVSAWACTHPGGAKILQHFHGEDATDAFYAIHSEEALKRLQRMRKEPVTSTDPDPSDLLKNFRILTKQLQNDGWFDRNILLDILFVSIIIVLFVLAVLFSHSLPLLSILFLGLSMQQAGWVGHSYVHARHPVCWWAGRLISILVTAHSSEWWAEKHCAHHALPNYTDIDTDIQLAPVFYLTVPEAKDDSVFRKYQHLYAFPVYSSLYFSWRYQSLIYAWETKNYFELVLLAISYGVTFYLMPMYVVFGAILVGGFCVALVVTANHQSEEFYEPGARGSYDFVTAQFTTTRDAYNQTWLARWFWGGMDTQLEHHLFPMMPQYYYHALVPILKQFAKENNIEYRTEPAWDLIVRNFQTMKRVAQAPAQS